MSQVNITEADLAVIRAHGPIIAERRQEFAGFFFDFFYAIPETRIVIEHYGRPDALKQTWALWFERLFSAKIDTNFINYLWRIGLKHVEISLDQRFSNLGFSIVRQFCQRTILQHFPCETALEILPAIDKLIDFCTLVETSAYIDATIRCDVEILKGIADKIRNPVTIIGGNLRRLQRHVDPGETLFGDYEFLIASTRHCEDMIEDINTYMEIFERPARLECCSLDTIVDNILEKISARKKLNGIRVEVSIEPSVRFVQGDPTDLRQIFYQLIENAAEAALSAADPYVSIKGEPQEGHPHMMRVEIFNNGDVLNAENIANILTPFYSTRSRGSGLGLSIVKLAVRKNYGELHFEPAPPEGTKVYVIFQKGSDKCGQLT